jgi:hypothetical protein
MMHICLVSALVLLPLVHAQVRGLSNGGDLKIAVFGDWPYSQALLDNKANLINSVNGDAEVSLVVHLGDIHSGSMPCTGAGVNRNGVTLTTGGLVGLVNPVGKWRSHLNLS